MRAQVALNEGNMSKLAVGEQTKRGRAKDYPKGDHCGSFLWDSQLSRLSFDALIIADETFY